MTLIFIHIFRALEFKYHSIFLLLGTDRNKLDSSREIVTVPMPLAELHILMDVSCMSDKRGTRCLASFRQNNEIRITIWRKNDL